MCRKLLLDSFIIRSVGNNYLSPRLSTANCLCFLFCIYPSFVFFSADVFQEFFSPVTAAQTLLCTVVTRRKEMLQRTMGFIMAILTNNDGPTDPRHKAGALHMVGAVAETLLQVCCDHVSVTVKISYYHEAL